MAYTLMHKKQLQKSAAFSHFYFTRIRHQYYRSITTQQRNNIILPNDRIVWLSITITGGLSLKYRGLCVIFFCGVHLVGVTLGS